MLIGRKRVSSRAFIFHPEPFSEYQEYLDKLKNEEVVIYNLSKPQMVSVYFSEITDNASEDDLISKYRRIFKISDEFTIIPFPDTFSAISSLIFLYMDLNDEIAIPEPFPPYIWSIVDYMGVKISPIETFHSNGFRLPLRDVLEPILNPRVKIIFYTNPQLTTGTLYNSEEIERLLFISQNYNILMVADESFSTATELDNMNNLLGLASRYENAVSLNRILLPFTGVSTCFLISRGKVAEIIKRFQETLFPLSNALIRVTYTALDRFSEILPSMPGFLGERRDILYEVVSGFEDFFIIKPDSPPAGVIKLPIKDARKYVRFMLEDFRMDNRTTFVLPLNSLFFDEKKGKNLVMIDFSNIDVDTLKTGLNIMFEGVKQFKKEVG